MNIFFVNDTTAWYHWGCTGTSSILTERMKQSFHLIDSLSAKETYAQAWVDRPDTINGFQDKTVFAAFCKSNPLLIDRIHGADKIVINGEGTIHGLKYPPLNLLYLAYISKVFFHKKVEIINHSVFPEDSAPIPDPQARAIYQLVYQNLDYVAVRESISLNILNEIQVKANLTFDCLPLYIKEHYIANPVSTSKNLIFAGTAAWSEFNAKAMADYLRWMARQGCQVILLTGSNETHSDDSKMMTYPSDVEAVKFFEHELHDVPWELIDAKSMTEWLDVIANAELLVSGRFHHTIAAICLGRPFVVLNSNTPKIDGCMKVCGLPAALQYRDPDLYANLVTRTEGVLADSNKDENNLLFSRLCEMAENNFISLAG